MRLLLMSMFVFTVAAGVWVGISSQDSTAPDAAAPQSTAGERRMDETTTRDNDRKTEEPPPEVDFDALADELVGEEIEEEPEPAPGCGDYTGNRRIACDLLPEHGFDSGQMSCLSTLWERESGWNEKAENPGSGAYGIPQALPGNKMASAGDDWQSNPATQIRWGLDYISGRYGTPCGAWSFFQANNWY